LGVVYIEKLSRLSIFNPILGIPQLLVVGILGIVDGICIIIAWLAILFTGKHPKGLFDFIAGYLRWWVRVEGYVLLLTDKYPPFSQF
jgi:hypothetical protein